MISSRIAFGFVTLLIAFVAMHITSASLEAAQREVVHYRLVASKTMHLDDEEEAKAIYQILKRLGCECEHADHGNHYDLHYRCPQWKSIELKSHAEAHRWEDWLKLVGFETRHEH